LPLSLYIVSVITELTKPGGFYMRNKKVTLLLAFVLTFSVVPTFASSDIEVMIDSNKISFNTAPEMYGDTIMVPMKEFFEAMGARIVWVESERMIIAYKDNMHMKLQLGNKIAFRNGKRFKLESEPYIREGRTMVPIQIIAETFNMKPEWNEETEILSLEGSDDDAGLKLFQDGIYKTRPIDELGITISIPYHWGKLDGPFQYGYQDDFESYSVSLISQPIDDDMTLAELVDMNKSLLLKTYSENITFTGEELMNIDDLLQVKKLYITTIENETPQKQVLYILKQNDTAYFMTCHYGAEVPEEDMIVVFDNVISTFKIRNLSIDSEEEHYMEFEDFYKYNIQLNQEYYSNMVIEKSQFTMSGTLKEGHGLDSFNVKVSKDQDSLEFIIPISGNAFDGTLYTPFGLGKHNIFITGVPSVLQDDNVDEEPLSDNTLTNETVPNQDNVDETPIEDNAPESNANLDETNNTTDSDVITNEDEDNSSITSEDTTDDPIQTEVSDPVDEVIESSINEAIDETELNGSNIPLIQFSIINIDSRTMRYLIPTSVINSSDTQINSTSKLITYQVSNQYMKARELYQWMIKNIKLSTELESGLTNVQVFDTAVGSPEEINQLFVAFLRALDIPSRVMKGTVGEDVNYWTELYLNGSWGVSDVIEGINVQDDIANPYSQNDLFNTNIDIHRQKYDLIQIMPY